jgi:RNase P subunit RPR2
MLLIKKMKFFYCLDCKNKIIKDETLKSKYFQDKWNYWFSIKTCQGCIDALTFNDDPFFW